MSAPLKRTAIVYDFDGTLAPGNIQEHSLLPHYLGTDKEAFWAEVKSRQARHDADQILVYLQLLLELARSKEKRLSSRVLEEQGAKTPFFEGVEGWFARINAHAAAAGLCLEHYIVSSGNEEMIRGCAIAPHFKQIFACKYIYNEAGEAIWPGSAVNYTTKTQYLFRINKGVETHADDESVNRWVAPGDRPIPFERMLYLGDGDTDIPSMKMVRHQGGHSVAVFDPQKWADQASKDGPQTREKAYKLIAEDRADFVVPADYQDGSQLDVTVKGLLGRIAQRG